MSWTITVGWMPTPAVHEQLVQALARIGDRVEPRGESGDVPLLPERERGEQQRAPAGEWW